MLFCLSPRCYHHLRTLRITVTITFCKRLLTDAKEGAVVQLKLLDLMIRNQSEAVPMDAKAQTEIIDLMARILMVVFQAEGGTVDARDTVQSQD